MITYNVLVVYKSSIINISKSGNPSLVLRFLFATLQWLVGAQTHCYRLIPIKIFEIMCISKFEGLHTLKGFVVLFFKGLLCYCLSAYSLLYLVSHLALYLISALSSFFFSSLFHSVLSRHFEVTSWPDNTFLVPWYLWVF